MVTSQGAFRTSNLIACDVCYAVAIWTPCKLRKVKPDLISAMFLAALANMK